MPEFRIQPMDLRAASEEQYGALIALNHALETERHPGDPLATPDELRARWRHIPDFVTIRSWLAWDDDRAIGYAECGWENSASNAHALMTRCEVLAPFRRQGVGRALLARIVATAQDENRRLLIGNTSDRIPAGEMFAKRLGAQPGMADRVSQLDLATLDRTLIDRWLVTIPAHASDYTIEFWDGAVPDADLVAYAELMNVMNDAPHDDLEVEDRHETPEQVREAERSLQSAGRLRWTIVARQQETHALAGFTEVFLNLRRPTIVWQGGTAVVPAHRGHSLGRWLKAAMLDRVLRDWPDGRFVRTNNADSNAPMLRINTELGFVPYESAMFWQVATEQTATYLAASTQSDGPPNAG